jgi:hypothetical protein
MGSIQARASFRTAVFLLGWLLAQSGLAAPNRLLLHWGTPEHNAILLWKMGYGPYQSGDRQHQHWQDLNYAGHNAEPNWYAFEHVRNRFRNSQQGTLAHVLGPALYLSYSFKKWSKSGTDLLVFELQNPHDADLEGRRDAREPRDIAFEELRNRDRGSFATRLESRMPLSEHYSGNPNGYGFGPGHEDVALFRALTAEERATGLRVFARPPTPGDVEWIWQENSHSWEQATELIEHLQWLTSREKGLSRSTMIVGERLLYDRGLPLIRTIAETHPEFLTRSPAETHRITEILRNYRLRLGDDVLRGKLGAEALSRLRPRFASAFPDLLAN